MTLLVDTNLPAPGHGVESPSNTLSVLEDRSGREGPLRLVGSPEVALAEIMLLLEESRDRETTVRHDAERERIAHESAAIDDTAREAKLQLAKSVIQAGLSVAGAACDVAGSARASAAGRETSGAAVTTAPDPAGAAPVAPPPTTPNAGGAAKVTGAVINAVGTVTSPVLEFYASGAEQDAKREGLQASAFKQIVDEATTGRSEADRSVQRAYDAMQELGRLRAEAIAAALRP